MTARALPVEPSAPDTLHIDVAAALAQITPHPLGPMPHPEDAMELQLLQAARECAAGKAQLPRRELVDVALREAERQQWWRDLAEAEQERLRLELAKVKAGHAEDLAHHHEQRRRLLSLHFELIAWAATQLNCEASSSTVLAKIRAKGCGLLRADVDAGTADRMRGGVSNG